MIYQVANNPDGVIFSPELLDDQDTWAFLRTYQVNSDDESDEEREQVKALQYGKPSSGLKSYLNKKEKNIRANTQSAGKPGADGAASQEGQERQNFDRLCGILD